jgi:bifunctional non-homologous end joining protein LigD
MDLMQTILAEPATRRKPDARNVAAHSATQQNGPMGEQWVTAGGRRVRLTNLDKVLYPESGTTKGEVIAYYTTVAPVMLPLLRDRPVTRKRWVHGVGTDADPGSAFIQKDLGDSAPEWVERRLIRHKDHVNEYPVANELATLVWMAQIGSLEIHVPQWRFDERGAQQNPDRLVLDLDPGPGTGLAECAEVARLARDILTAAGLDPMPVTSGSKGIHLYAPLDGSQTSDQASAVAHELARALEADHPDLVVSDMKRSLRDGKVLVDWSQNSGNKTTVSPYSLRGRSHPMVATPRTWDELDDPDFAHLDFRQVMERVAAADDATTALPSALPPPPLAASAAVDDQIEAPHRDRLALYRSKRDANKTPEPVPATTVAAKGGGRPIYVIQEHHARRLHWDFRLEHDGVLVSWALPKGVPTDWHQNHLAVPTEDHPMEYASFAGTIPAGEYGAGDVTIWDSGHFELEKWRDGKEVIATLTGTRLQEQRFALIHTGDAGWLIHLMKPEGAPTARPHAGRTTVGTARRPTRSFSPMLASGGTEADIRASEESGQQWAYELKWDGLRAIATVESGNVTLETRNGVNVTSVYPELAALAGATSGDATLDGEIIAIGPDGTPDFGRLQRRMGLTDPGEIERMVDSDPVQMVVFDVLRTQDHPPSDPPLITLPYAQRRTILRELLTPNATIQLPEAFEGDLDEALRFSRALGLEGVMAKKTDSSYLPGRRSKAWVKLKHSRAQEVVIGGWRTGKGRRESSIGSLLMGIPTENGLRYVGRVGTGFTGRDIDAITARLARLERKTSPFDDVPASDSGDAHWVTPHLVGEVEFAEWTPTGRLRQPSWRGWRPDKNPEDVTTE